MKGVSVGIFHDDEALLNLLGKKGTTSDMLFSNRKEGDVFYTFIEPREGKISAKCQIIQSVDIPILRIEEINPEVGETILMLDAAGKTHGILCVPDFLEDDIKKLAKDTVVSSYIVCEKEFGKIMDAINSFEIKRNPEEKTVVEVDHFFNVKGVGTVILGFVKSGTVRKHDKLRKLPEGKEVIVRSIQMHDKDFDEAEDGCRIGLALKGVEAEDFSRGTLLCKEGTLRVCERFEIAFRKNKFYQEDISEGMNFHASSGMRFFPVKVESVNGEKLVLKSDRKIPAKPGMKIMLINLNAAKLHLAGSGTISRLG